MWYISYSWLTKWQHVIFCEYARLYYQSTNSLGRPPKSLFFLKTHQGEQLEQIWTSREVMYNRALPHKMCIQSYSIHLSRKSIISNRYLINTNPYTNCGIILWTCTQERERCAQLQLRLTTISLSCTLSTQIALNMFLYSKRAFFRQENAVQSRGIYIPLYHKYGQPL